MKPANLETTRQTENPQARQEAWVCVFLALAVLAVFGQTAGFGFVNYDDDVYVYENAKVTSGLTMKGMAWVLSHAECHFYHPLTMISLMLDNQLHGLHAGGYHLTNVLLHGASSVLLFLILRRMTGALWRSAFVAAVFAIHPLRVESVAWVAERKDVLATFFFMLTLGAYVRYARHPDSPGRYLAVAGFFVTGLLCKPTAVTLPLVLLLLDYWPLGRMAKANRKAESSKQKPDSGEQRSAGVPFWELVKEKIPLLVLAALASVATYFAVGKAVKSVAQIPIPVRIGNLLVSYVIYLRQMVWPSGLAALYPYPEKNYPVWEIAAAFVVLAGVTGVVLALRGKRPWLMVDWFWYLGMLVPVIGIVQVGGFAHADRNTYLPQIGLNLMLTWAAAEMTRGWRHRRVARAGLSGAILAVLIYCAEAQTYYWRESESLWRHTLSCTSGNTVAESNLGDALFLKGEKEEAVAQYRKALEINPDYELARNNLGFVLFKKGELEGAIAEYRKALEIQPDDTEAHYRLGIALAGKGDSKGAIAQFEKALEINPGYAEADNDLGTTLCSQGRVEEGIARYRKALELKPGYADAHLNLGVALTKRGQMEEAIGQLEKALEINPGCAEAENDVGMILFGQGRVEEAVGRYRKALELKPDLAEARYNLGTALLGEGDLEGAIACYRQTIRINPRSAEARANLGVALLKKGETKEAIDCWQEALEINRDQIPVLNNLAWALATTADAALRNGARAVALAAEADKSSGGGNAMILRTLAAAYAEEGSYGLAEATARRAVELAVAQKNDTLAATLQKEIELYVAERPAREGATKGSEMARPKEAPQRGEPTEREAPR
ncbi:MAG: tetratricopeptide repeat protein [Verrucomicrobiota bacterium]